MTVAELYNGHLVVAHANQNNGSGFWSVTVDISNSNTRRSETIYSRDEFKTREEAERWGVRQAREWIDGNI